MSPKLDLISCLSLVEQIAPQLSSWKACRESSEKFHAQTSSWEVLEEFSQKIFLALGRRFSSYRSDHGMNSLSCHQVEPREQMGSRCGKFHWMRRLWGSKSRKWFHWSNLPGRRWTRPEELCRRSRRRTRGEPKPSSGWNSFLPNLISLQFNLFEGEHISAIATDAAHPSKRTKTLHETTILYICNVYIFIRD